MHAGTLFGAPVFVSALLEHYFAIKNGRVYAVKLLSLPVGNLVERSPPVSFSYIYTNTTCSPPCVCVFFFPFSNRILNYTSFEIGYFDVYAMRLHKSHWFNLFPSSPRCKIFANMNILLCGEYYVIACVEDELRSKFKRMKMLYFIRDALYFSPECLIWILDLEKKKLK